MLSDRNKFLLVEKDVILNEKIDESISLLDSIFEKENVTAYVSSGVRTAEKQLQLIKNYAKQYGIDRLYPSIKICSLSEQYLQKGKEVYCWQPAWSKLLNIGIIISPPLEAEVLFDYIKKDGRNAKGVILQSSPHIKGMAFDVRGIVFEYIFKNLNIINYKIKSYLIEPKQNCIHFNCIL